MAASLVRACALGGVRPVRHRVGVGRISTSPPGCPAATGRSRLPAGRSTRLTFATTDAPAQRSRATSAVTAVSLPSGGPTAVDVLAVVTGPRAAVAPLVLAGHGAATIVVLVVDPAPDRVLGAVDAATVVPGPRRAEDLLRGWDLVAR